ncbi:hypothetical protein C8R44DRAFT_801487 [Mycena epipterygia]|nr:hypothetical protein C8R44DRAFT_801487 [Mycena epipterygia]
MAGSPISRSLRNGFSAAHILVSLLIVTWNNKTALLLHHSNLFSLWWNQLQFSWISADKGRIHTPRPSGRRSGPQNTHMLGLFLGCGVSGKSQPYVLALMVYAEPLAHTRQRSSEDEEHAQLLNDAFTSKFEGNAVDLFCDAMGAYANAFNPNEHYGKIIAWHGPSGAGKSKAVDALREKFPTYTICFRASDDPSDGWPPGDGPAYQFFDTSAGSATPEERVAAFLGAFFQVAANELDVKVPPASSARDSWTYKYAAGSSYEESTRGILFSRVAKRAQERLGQPMEVDMEEDFSSQAPTVESKLAVEPERRYRQLWKRYCEIDALALVRKLSSIPYCFIALDECTDIPDVEPIALRRILEAGHHISQLWFILLGTNAKIQSLVLTSSHIKPSARFARLRCLPAWCYFGFGQLAPLEPTTPQNALQVEYLRKIGRPLFATYKTAGTTFRNASKKLFAPQLAFNPHQPIHVLTAFSHRIMLELGSTVTAHQMAAETVNSNLRYATRIDGEIVRTICPSEPLLSLVSTDVLNKDNNFAESLRTLVDAVKKATIDRGQEGELYCRLLIIRARDVACQKRLGTQLTRKLLAGDNDVELNNADYDIDDNYDIDDTFSQASFVVRIITLEEHLDALVHLSNMDSSAASKLRELTKSYHVNVTHMVQFHDVISAIPQAYLRRLFVRGAAVQCCHSQPVIDGFYVAYGGDLDKAFDLAKFMVVAWQSKAKAAAASQGELVASLTGPMQIDPAGKRCKPAQLVLLMDLNAKAAFKSTTDRHLQVTYRQASLPVYPPSKKHDANQKPWGGYAVAPNETEPLTWCLNIRGHDKTSYPCTAATPQERDAPNFSALFDEVGPDIMTNSIIAEASRSANACLHPLGNF